MSSAVRALRVALLLALLAAVASTFLLLPSTAAADRTDPDRQVPAGWLGVAADGPLNFADPRFAGEWGRMARAGAESVRVAFFWNAIQPFESFAEVPAEERAAGRYRNVRGVPTDFFIYDGVVAAAARQGLQILPVVQRAARWAALRPEHHVSSPPRDPREYAALMTALVERYGPAGSFWDDNPELPRMEIRDWQIWNEPNVELFWNEQPFAARYVELLRHANRALKGADPGSRTIGAGLTFDSWFALRQIYAAGGHGAFDAIAVHPYSGSAGSLLRILRKVRWEARLAGDGERPIWVTEFSWPASQGLVGSAAPTIAKFETTSAGQATRLAATLPRLERARRRLGIERVFWYTWLTDDGSGLVSWDWSGLRRVRGGDVVDTPALRIFRRAARRLQGCAKSEDARRCR